VPSFVRGARASSWCSLKKTHEQHQKYPYIFFKKKLNKPPLGFPPSLRLKEPQTKPTSLIPTERLQEIFGNFFFYWQDFWRSHSPRGASTPKRGIDFGHCSRIRPSTFVDTLLRTVCSDRLMNLVSAQASSAAVRLSTYLLLQLILAHEILTDTHALAACFTTTQGTDNNSNGRSATSGGLPYVH
jgi:hypothetical protein